MGEPVGLDEVDHVAALGPLLDLGRGDAAKHVLARLQVEGVPEHHEDWSRDRLGRAVEASLEIVWRSSERLLPVPEHEVLLDTLTRSNLGSLRFGQEFHTDALADRLERRTEVLAPESGFEALNKLGEG